MHDDPLQQLLQAAEQASADPSRSFAPESLLAAARRRRLRRTATRSAATACVVALLAAPLLTSNEPPTPPVRPTHATIAHAPAPPHVAAPDHESVQRELAALEREAAMHQQIIAAVLAPDLAEEVSKTPGLSDAELVRLETARSAALSLQCATIAERELQDFETARREYERVAERFPGTEWADVAGVSLQRLKPIDPMPL